MLLFYSTAWVINDFKKFYHCTNLLQEGLAHVRAHTQRLTTLIRLIYILSVDVHDIPVKFWGLFLFLEYLCYNPDQNPKLNPNSYPKSITNHNRNTNPDFQPSPHPNSNLSPIFENLRENPHANHDSYDVHS